jgi:hypothetical protein
MGETRGKYKGIWFTIKEADKPGFYYFEFEIEGELVRGRTETRLVGVAVYRARRAINRKLKEMRHVREIHAGGR